MKRAFTLIELLIVVLIISILASIATPNFLEFQVRAKIARAKADMRTLRTCLEAYRVDNGQYPIDHDEEYSVPIRNEMWSWRQLTTPIAYISSIPFSPFVIKPPRHHNPYGPQEPYVYWGPSSQNSRRWHAFGAYFAVMCAGPDQDIDFGENVIEELMRDEGPGLDTLYDPTNGTVSNGDVVMTARGFHN